MRLDWNPAWRSLVVSLAWAQHHCVVPDGFNKGAPWRFRRWQQWCWLNFYRVKPDALPSVDANGQPPEGVRPAAAFVYRRSQIVLPQKAGKAPYTSAHVCNESVGPAIFAGFARGGEVYDCAEHGCPCGWVYEYSTGEAMGVPWPTPLIQITATSEDQTDNVYDALRPMIDYGPLSVVIPKTGEEFIRLPGDGEIATVTSNATSRVGQRVTFIPHDETGLYTKSNGMVKVAETQRRGLAGMGGRGEETTNGWDPTEDSVAQRTAAAAEKGEDIFRFHPLADPALNYRNKGERRKIHKAVYLKPTVEEPEDGTPWIDLDVIEGEAAELVDVDPAQGERFFGNRIVAGGGAAVDIPRWNSLAKPKHRVPDGAEIVIGIDGARYWDALAVVACEIKTGHVWPLEVIERPDDEPKDSGYEHDRAKADGAVREAFEKYMVWRVYCDPQHLDYLMEGWRNTYGEKRIIDFPTYQPRRIAWAVREFRDAVTSGDISHPGSPVLDRHIGNAKLEELSGHILDEHERQMHTIAKEFRGAHGSAYVMDAAMASVIVWKGRSDAIQAGVVVLNDNTPEPPAPKPPQANQWQPGQAPNLAAFASSGASAPGDIS